MSTRTPWTVLGLMAIAIVLALAIGSDEPGRGSDKSAVTLAREAALRVRARCRVDTQAIGDGAARRRARHGCDRVAGAAIAQARDACVGYDSAYAQDEDAGLMGGDADWTDQCERDARGE